MLIWIGADHRAAGAGGSPTRWAGDLILWRKVLQTDGTRALDAARRNKAGVPRDLRISASRPSSGQMRGHAGRTTTRGRNLAPALDPRAPCRDADVAGVFVSGQKRGVFGVIKRELRRRSAIEPVTRDRPHERATATSADATSKAATVMPPTSSSPPSATISASSSPG
jgi:hypothetical protein